MNVLEVGGIRKSYGGVRALDDCTAAFAEGAISGLIGPNGSGKTTLFNVISGYETADLGRVRLRGQDITGFTRRKVLEAGIGRTFQLTRVFPRLTVTENICVAARRRGFLAQMRGRETAAERQHAMDVLSFTGLDKAAEQPAGALSYGQQKLLELAIVMAAGPKVMLLDEPAAGVNPRLLGYIAERICELNSRHGVTFVIVEHDMSFVMGLCKKVTVMNQGRVIATGTPAQIRSDPAVLDAYLGAEN